tara:strand:- start:1495 stop:1782 length:288 start_codon:yes stop_codon:yes gene_type:complete
MGIITNIFDKALYEIHNTMTGVGNKEDFSEETEEDSISAKSAWALLILALVVRFAVIYYILPYLWNESVKELLSLKTVMDGKTAVIFIALLEFLI